ncbi:PilZ domain-containing protein [Pelagibacterium sp. H642]|uniref:PilZ domain-containing protein n=1 Tax=Pelagibacterium sp. H642 TaxID=1881069 RepID=UPI0035C16388
MRTMIERRKELREQPVLRGPAAIIEGPTSVEVTILNASSGGLMIRVPPGAAISTLFTLSIGEHLQSCHLIWRHGKLLGARLSN